MTLNTHPSGLFIMRALVLLGNNQHTKFELPTFVDSKDMIGCLKFNKNSSGDEIANVNFLRRYGTYVLQNTKKENLLRLTN